jgi:23S rRNA pseudouridine2605 synthase
VSEAAPPPRRTRLNKLLAERIGLARRKCDEAILAGEVAIDGETVIAPGVAVDPTKQRVTWRGRPIPRAPAFHYLALHKPLGVLVTWDDPQGRTTIRSYVPRGLPRLFAVGRLDADTSGLLLLMNDGDLAHRLAHPRYEVPKTYRLTLAGPPQERQLQALRAGVRLDDGDVTSPARAELEPSGTEVRLTIAEGKNRQVRRMCEALGLPLVALERVAFGPVVLGSLPVGQTRLLTRDELRRLRAASLGSGTPRPESGVEPPRARPRTDRRTADPRRGTRRR